MWNDADIEMAELHEAARCADAQRHGREANRFDVNWAIRDAVAHLRFTGGESSFDAMMNAIQDRADVAWTEELRSEVQLTAWDRYIANPD